MKRSPSRIAQRLSFRLGDIDNNTKFQLVFSERQQESEGTGFYLSWFSFSITIPLSGQNLVEVQGMTSWK